MFDPRTKLLLALAGAVLVAMTRKLGWLAAEWALLAFLAAVRGHAKTYLRWLVMLVPMATFFGGLTWWSTSLAVGAAAALALLAITTVFFVFFATTSPEDLGNSLVKAGLPFPAAFVLTAAMQMAPVIGRKAGSIVEAQQARGIALNPGWRALRRYPALLVPLLIQSFQTAEAMAEAMEARGFGRPNRTFRQDYRMGFRDWLVVVGGWTVVIGLFLWGPLR
jgi:energy-coupling factor transport system permease protein